MTKDKLLKSWNICSEGERLVGSSLLTVKAGTDCLSFLLKMLVSLQIRTPRVHDVVTKVARSYTFVKTDIETQSIVLYSLVVSFPFWLVHLIK